MAKAIGAKILKKKLEAQQAKDKAKFAAMAKDRGGVNQNQAEFLDRDKQKFDITKMI